MESPSASISPDVLFAATRTIPAIATDEVRRVVLLCCNSRVGRRALFFAGVSAPVVGFVVEFQVLFTRLPTFEQWRAVGWLNWTRKTTGTIAPRINIGDAATGVPAPQGTPQVSLNSGNNWFSTFDFSLVIFNTLPAVRNVHCNIGGVPCPSAGNLPDW